jgi:hypothetical protein
MQALAEPPQPPPGPRPVSFGNDVMPLLCKMGCNETACHGALPGKGNFRLSLFGAETAADYDSLTRSAQGRRINRLDPAQSLLLLKATASMPHQGGKKLDAGSPEYGVLLSWIAQGARADDASQPKLVEVKAAPAEQTLAKGDKKPLSVTAIYSDGSRRDVTRQAGYASLDPKVAAVDAGGLVEAKGWGEAVILVSCLRRSDVARLLIPQPPTQPFPKLAPNNKIDELVFAKLQKLGMPPSDVASDEVFLRRVFLDLIGTLPSPDEARAFLQDADPQKRGKLIDRLMEREEFADWWALKWGDLLRIKSEYPVRVWPKASQTYYRWVRQSLAENRSYDQFARELLTATGSNFRCGAVNFVRANPNKDPQTMAESAALVFMGVRLGCARCHGHPTENWSVDDNLGMAAFFAKVAFKSTQEWKEEIVYVNRKGELHRPQTWELLPPKFLGGQAAVVSQREDPRAKLADWLIRPENPYFVKNIVNRAWFWFLGRGIVHEPDDLRPSNPPSNPELLAFLEQDFVQHKYDLRHLFRQILGSKTYQLSSKANAGNKDDVRHFSRFYLRRLSAEQLLDAIGQVTETSEPFWSPIPEPYTRLPPGYRAEQLYDGDISAPFLELFGRPSRDTPYECERDLKPLMRQSLHLINSEHVQNRINSSPRLQRWLAEKKSDAQIVDELYLIALARPPKAEEKKGLLEFLAREPNRRAEALQDAVWTLINTKEFVLNH